MRLSTSRLKGSAPVCKGIAKSSQIEGPDPSIPSFCSDANHEGKHGLRLSNPTDVTYLKRYISSLLKSFYQLDQENRLLRLQLEDLRCAKANQMESERWMR